MSIRKRLLSNCLRDGDLWLTLVLGAVGFLFNMLELQLGWGLHFIFGNALIFAFVRVLRPQSLVLAASISSLRSIFLWNHPWAWGIWTLEAAFIAYFTKKASPVRIDVLYWLLIGSPLLAISYGIVMDMDRLSLFLVISKQKTNGVLNVAIGEIIYLATINLKNSDLVADWPEMPIESFLMMLLLSIILIPTTVYLYIDAPAREQAARANVGVALQNHLRITGKTISIWAHSSSTALSLFAERQLAGGVTRANGPPQSLSREFSGISVVSNDGTPIWTTLPIGVPQIALRQLAMNYEGRRQGVQLVYIEGHNVTTTPQLALLVPFVANGSPAAIIAIVRQGALEQLLSDADPDGEAVGRTFLFNSAANILPLSQADSGVIQRIRSIPPSQRESALKAAVLMSDAAYGNSIMSDLRDARLIRAIVVPGLPDWQVLSVARLAPEVLNAREGQLQMFTALAGFMLLVTLIASFLSKRTELALRQLAQSAADLAAWGTRRETIDSLVIAELNEISGKIASVSSIMSRERTTLVSFQRRLNSISRHAPIMLYALDVSDYKRVKLVYMSAAVEKILGYTQDETTLLDWWRRAIHPEDFDRCIAAFSNWHSGKVVNAEYRLRHKLGHYVWVYDTLAVEADPKSDHLEAVGVIIDIDERKSATEQLIQADKMTSLGRLVSGTAHELNQPLNFIKMAASNLREHARRGPLDSDQIISKLNRILSHVSRASAIILQMRIFGRIPKEIPFPMEVRAAVDSVLAMAGPQLDLNGVRAETCESMSGVKVRALPVLLEQVLLNLVLNAADSIRVRRNAGDQSNGWIKVSIARSDYLAVVTVDDNGTGLPADILPMIFEPFFTTKPPKEGTGLGLSISYGIIRDLGGTIRAENTENGARFTIELPLAE